MGKKSMKKRGNKTNFELSCLFSAFFGLKRFRRKLNPLNKFFKLYFSTGFFDFSEIENA